MVEKHEDASSRQIKADFARKLHSLMVERGLNQSELARRASQFTQSKMERSSISVYMRGRSLPKPTALYALARALDIETTELLPSIVLDARMGAAQPPLEIQGIPGNPKRAWLKINREVTFDQAVKIMQILETNGD